MARWSAGVVLAAALGCAALAFPRTAAAYSCLPPRLISPPPGTPLPSNGLIWDVCYRTYIGDPEPMNWCPPPTLTDSTGRLIELVVDQRVQSTRYARILTAYRPSEALVVGDPYRLESDQEFVPFSDELDVVDADVEVPPLPVLKAVDFSVRQVFDGHGAPFHARFTFEPFEGNLIVDPEGLLESPFEGLEFSPTISRNKNSSVPDTWLSSRERADGDRSFFLAKELCYTNFETANWGAPVSVRFGVLDFAGNFSGWSEPVSIEFPTEVTDYPVVHEPDVDHEPQDYSRVNSISCSTTNYGASSKTWTSLFLLAAAGLMRRARSRLTRL